MAVPQQEKLSPDVRPWPALWALVLGFFMILVDTTIVSVATPAILNELHSDVGTVVWVTSAYLLAYAVPLLITGRLGDRVGPKKLYLAGLTLFTLASVWCGLTTSIEMLIVARVFQGLGAAMMTPQTMAVITRIFPPNERGRAMSLWGATAGVATLVGPILGGVLVDGLGWQWIFFVNAPIGVVGFVLAWRLVPDLPTHEHKFDLVGVALSTVGLFCLVFGIQEGQKYDWGQIKGPLSVWSLIIMRPGVHRAVPGLAGADQDRAVAAAVVVQGPQLLAGEHRDHHSRVRDHRDGVPVDAVRADRARAEPDPVGAAAGADGRHLGCAGAVRGTADRQGAATVHRRVRPALLLGVAVLAQPGDRADSPDLGTVAADRAARCRERVHVGADRQHRDAEPADAPGRSGRGRLQHHPSGRSSAGQRGHRRTDGGAAGGEPADGAGGAAAAEGGGGKLPEALHQGFSDAMAQSLMLPAAVLVIGLIAALFFTKPKYLER